MSKINKTRDPKQEAGSKKLGFNHIPLGALIALSKGMAPGVPKYGAKNWYTTDSHNMMVYLDAINRHWMLCVAGEDYVRDAGNGKEITHVDAILSGCGVLADTILLGSCQDDRVKMSDAQLNMLARELCGKDYADLPIIRKEKTDDRR